MEIGKTEGTLEVKSGFQIQKKIGKSGTSSWFSIVMLVFWGVALNSLFNGRRLTIFYLKTRHYKTIPELRLGHILCISGRLSMEMSERLPSINSRPAKV